VVSASPTPNEQPSPSASPSGGGFEEALEATEGLTFSDPEGAVKRSQLRAIRGSIKGVGRIQGVTVKSVQTDGEEPTIVALAVIAPVEGSTSREVFGALLDAISLTGRVSQAMEGEAFRVIGDDFKVVITPVAVKPILLVLIATGDPNAPVEEITRKLLASLSRSLS
jgi:hypothetical protein